MTTTQQSGGPVIPEFTVGDRLRKARGVTGLDIRKFAELIGVSHGSVYNVEKGRVQPRKIILNAYSLATGVPVEWLETGAIAHAGPDGSGSPTRSATRG